MIEVWWWIERSWERLNGFSMYLVIVCFVKSLDVDRGLVRKHSWIGNFGRGVVLGIHNFIVIGYWWATSLFVKFISHILFAYMRALGNLLVMCQFRLFHSSVDIVWDVGIECSHVFMWVLGKMFMLKGVF